MDFKKIILGLLSGAYKLDEGQATELLNEDGEDVSEETVLAKLLEADTARVSKLAPKPGFTFKDGYNKGLSETMTKFEKELKATYGITSNATGGDLVAEILASQAGTEGAPDSEEAVKKHPVYIQMQRDFKKQLEEAKAEAQKQVEAVKNGYAKEKASETVRKRGLAVLNGLNPNLPEDKEVADTQVGTFLDTLGALYDFDLSGENIIVLGKDGNAAVDDHGHNLEFNDVIAARAAKFFGIKKNNGGSQPGNNNDTPKPGAAGAKKVYPAGIKRPTTFDEAVKLSNDKRFTLEERAAILDQWEADNPGK